MVWDKSYGLGDLANNYSIFRDKTIDVCTVRSLDLATASVGTLFWTLAAANVARYANKVNIYDFDLGKGQRGASQLPVEELARILSFPVTVRIYRSEDIDTALAWEQLNNVARSGHIPNGIHPDVAGKLSNLKSGEQPLGLTRMAEELAVFLQGYEDADRVQLSAHEHETVTLVRASPISVGKQYARVVTGIDGSEFNRDRIPKIAEFGGRLLSGQNQGDNYHQFYRRVIEMLAKELFYIANGQNPEPSTIEEKWIEYARINREYFFTRTPYNPTIGESGISPKRREISIDSFRNMLMQDVEKERFKLFCRIADQIHPTLLVHLLREYHGEFEMHLGDYDASQESIAKVIEQGLVREGIDKQYLGSVLNSILRWVPAVFKEGIVDCLMGQKSKDERKDLYSRILSEPDVYSTIIPTMKTAMQKPRRKKEKIKLGEGDSRIERLLTTIERRDNRTLPDYLRLLSIKPSEVAGVHYEKWTVLIREGMEFFEDEMKYHATRVKLDLEKIMESHPDIGEDY